MSWFTTLFLAALVLTGPSIAPAASTATGTVPEMSDHEPFDALLTRYVADAGVRYEAWAASAADREALTEYLATLTAAHPSGYSEDAELAFWINAYNAVTLDLVLQGYPVDSIKDLGGLFSSPWKKKLIEIEEHELTLNDIENEIIRPRFQEPRIHFALNCAARSCPPLRAGAYFPDRVREQLEEQTRAFFADSAHNSLDDDERLHLSKILEWYRGDFEADGTLIDWLRPYVPGLDAAVKAGTKVDVKFRGYDWGLNEAE